TPDCPAAMRSMFAAAFEHPRPGILSPGDHRVERRVLQLACRRGELTVDHREPLDVARPCIMTLTGWRRPVLRGCRIDHLAGDAPPDNLGPRCDVPHDLPDAVRPGNRLRRRPFRWDTIEQIRERRPRPHRAGPGSLAPSRTPLS